MAIEGTTIGEISRVHRSWSAAQTAEYIAGLPIWNGEVDVKQHFGGLQNRTYFATAPDGQKYAIRTGFDQFRTRQTSVVQCTIAAHTLGLGPRLVYAEPNLTVVEFVDGEGVDSCGCDDDVDDGVDCSYFMEVNLFEGDVVDFGFGLGEQFEGCQGDALDWFGQRGTGD